MFEPCKAHCRHPYMVAALYSVMKQKLLCIIGFTMLILACIGQNPCEDITCGRMCRGYDLWEQKCINGECVDDRMIEENSRECGFNPCINVVCDDICFGTELWKMTCSEGECVRDSIIEKDSVACGFTPEEGALEEEEYQVYNALIVKGFDLIASCFKSFSEIELIVIDDHTETDSGFSSDLERTLRQMSEQMPALDQETINDFKLKNGQSYPLSNNFDLPVKVLLFSDEEMEEIFNDGGWSAFYEKYPLAQGIMGVSRVGFNSTKDQALVYVGSMCDWLYGAGYYVLFTKENGVWVIQDEVMTWIS